MKLDLSIPSPLREMFQSCASICEPACCGLDAFDVSANAISRWLNAGQSEAGAVALQQLDALIERVAGHDGPVDSLDELRHDFGHEWANGAHCAEYLQRWRNELVRAQVYGPEER